MQRTILVSTDFSAAADNALLYACHMAADFDCRIVLVRIYSLPTSYAIEGLSITTFDDAMAADRDRLAEELEKINAAFPAIQVVSRLETGNFLETLEHIARDVAADMVVIGAAREYADLWLWGDTWLDALIAIPYPVLVVPRHSRYTGIRNVGFAYDNKKLCTIQQSETIKKLVRRSGAHLHILHVSPAPESLQAHKNAAPFRETFAELAPSYHSIVHNHIIKALAEAISEYAIDILIVAPHRHGIWDTLFNKSYTRQLALLNNLPVLAIHDDYRTPARL